MSDLYDILEYCLQEIEKGTDVETVLSRYPQYADELRPILETSIAAIHLAPLGPSPEMERRGRARVLQHAAQMREMQSKAQPSHRLWSVPLRRALVTLAVIGVLFVGSTRLVEASTTTLPGDNLYPVKRTWEDVRVFLTFNNQAREALEVEHENERLDELNDLFTVGRAAKVDFTGTVMSQNGDLWDVSKIPVLVSTQTQLGTQPVVIGNAVRVKGYTQSGGTVLAESVDLLPAGIPLPKVEDDRTPESGHGTPEGEQQQNFGGDSEEGFSAQGLIPTPQVESKSRDFSRSGLVTSLNGNTLVVNGQSMDISGAKIEGTLTVGTTVKVEGYFDAKGQFVVTKLEFQSSGSESDSSVGDNGSKDKSGDNTSEDNSGSHEDNGGDDHKDDSSSSGSGGGE